MQYIYKNFILQIFGYINVVACKILPIRHSTLVQSLFIAGNTLGIPLKSFSSDVVSL